MYLDINTCKNKFNYIVTITDIYKNYNNKEEIIEQLILDLEKLKAYLIDEQYKRKLIKK